MKDVAGKVFAEGKLPATRLDLDRWMKTPPQPWTAAMEATVFTGWIYDHLQPHAAGQKPIEESVADDDCCGRRLVAEL